MWRLFITLYLSIIVFILGYDFIRNELVPDLYEDVFLEDAEKDLRGYVLALEAFTNSANEQELNEFVNKSNKESNFPVAVLSSAEAEGQYPKAISQVKESKVYFIDLYEYEFLYWMENQQKYLRIGPVQTVSQLIKLESLLEYVHPFLLAFVLLLWHLSLWRKLAGLEQIVVKFGDGELSARASEKPGIRVGKLNGSFNSMADKTEQLLQQNRQLIRAVSHELRAPISRIRCLVDLLETSDDHSKKTAYLDDMSEDMTELEGLVDEVLNYSQLEASSSVAIHVSEQSLERVLKELLGTMKREFSREIPLSCQSGICASIDEVHFRRAVGNLVQNAAKYCSKVVEVSVELDESHSSVLIHVDDDGPGIPVAERSRIFEPFSRLDQSRARASGGYGLGLAIVKQIAALHGGHVHVSSSPQGGARFSLEIPA